MTHTEENYLKALYTLSGNEPQGQSGTNDLAVHLNVKPASVSEMLKKLKGHQLVDYEKYGKIKLTESGWSKAVEIVRKHRLWETFLYQKLDFSWDEVHEIAEELEHISSTNLVDRLDQFLGYPKFDPHGDPIPDKDGKVAPQSNTLLSTISVNKRGFVTGVKDSSAELLQYADSLGVTINKPIKVIRREPYDGQTLILVDEKELYVSEKFAENIIVICENCAEGRTPGCCF